MKNIIGKVFECDEQQIKELNLKENKVDKDSLQHVIGGKKVIKPAHTSSTRKHCCAIPTDPLAPSAPSAG